MPPPACAVNSRATTVRECSSATATATVSGRVRLGPRTACQHPARSFTVAALLARARASSRAATVRERCRTTFAGLALLLNFFIAGAVSAAVFQYAAPGTTAKGESQAFLWIPAEAQKVRGVIMAGLTLMEREFVKDPVIRQACADEQLAMLFLKCGLGAVDLQKVLDDFARVSGYEELSAAPLFFVGHAAGNRAATVRERTEAGPLADARGSVDALRFGKRDQFIRWNDPVWVDAGARFFFTKIQWVGDGQTFEYIRPTRKHSPVNTTAKARAGRMPGSRPAIPVRRFGSSASADQWLPLGRTGSACSSTGWLRPAKAGG